MVSTHLAASCFVTPRCRMTIATRSSTGPTRRTRSVVAGGSTCAAPRPTITAAAVRRQRQEGLCEVVDVAALAHARLAAREAFQAFH